MRVAHGVVGLIKLPLTRGHIHYVGLVALIASLHERFEHTHLVFDGVSWRQMASDGHMHQDKRRHGVDGMRLQQLLHEC